MNSLQPLQHVYYVEAPSQKKPMGSIAINPYVIKNRFEWSDTSRGNYIKITAIKISDMQDEIEITTDEGEKIKFVMLTLKIFNEKVRDKVGGKTFATDQEVQDFYLNKNFGIY